MVIQPLLWTAVPVLDNPFSEEIFPNIQSKPSLVQLEAVSSRSKNPNIKICHQSMKLMNQVYITAGEPRSEISGKSKKSGKDVTKKGKYRKGWGCTACVGDAGQKPFIDLSGVEV